MKQWYTLYTKPNAEYKVATALRQRGLTIYLPEINDPKASQDRQNAPFFPCYLFLRIDFEVVGLSHVQWTPGLRCVLTFGDRPVPISNEVVNLLRYKLGETAVHAGQPAHTFKTGDVVRITEGPLRDMLAIFEKPTTSAQRVQVLLNILGPASRVQVEVADLEKASPSPEEMLKPQRPRRTRGRGRRINSPSKKI